MKKILYSFNKRGYEAEFWTREILAASNSEFKFIPFNHDPYLNPNLYRQAQWLDNLYFERHPNLMRLYCNVESIIREENIDALIVDNCAPYHPDWLKKIPIYKVLRTTDGPICAYERDFAYVHAYDHILYHSPAYSRDLSMREKLFYVGAKRADFLPLGVFEAAYDMSSSINNIMERNRDIDVIFVGALHLGKMEFIAKVKRVFGTSCRLYGINTWKRNAYFNLRYGFPGWLHTVPFNVYQKAKIGFNLHNRGDFSVGGYRLFELPANGVMQISDGGEHLTSFFDINSEIVGYKNFDELIDKIKYYLKNNIERERLALRGYSRVMQDYKMKNILRRSGKLIFPD